MRKGASQNIYELIGFRALQGIGFGAFVPATIAIAGDLFPPQKRGRIQGLLFSVNGVAFAVAPAMGSYLTELISWRWIFYINLPLGVVSFAIISPTLRESRNLRAGAFSDWAGASLLAASVSLLMMGFFLGGSAFQWESWQELALFAGSGVALISLVVVEGRAKDPVLPPRLFRIRTISAATVINMLRAMVLFGLVAYLPLFAQAALNGSVGDVRNAVYGLALPLTLGILISGAVIPRLGAKKTILIGATVLVIGIVPLLTLDSSSTVARLMELSVTVGLGSGLLIPPSIVAFQNSVKRNEIGVASGLSAFTLNLGSAVGVAALGAIQANDFASQLSRVFANDPSPAWPGLSDPNTVGQVLSSPQYLAKALTADPSLAVLLPHLREAFAHSILVLFPIAFVAGAAVLLAGFLVESHEEIRDVS